MWRYVRNISSSLYFRNSRHCTQELLTTLAMDVDWKSDHVPIMTASQHAPYLPSPCIDSYSTLIMRIRTLSFLSMKYNSLPNMQGLLKTSKATFVTFCETILENIGFTLCWRTLWVLLTSTEWIRSWGRQTFYFFAKNVQNCCQHARRQSIQLFLKVFKVVFLKFEKEGLVVVQEINLWTAVIEIV